MKFHVDEVDISEKLAGQLLTDQFPQWSEQMLTTVKSEGTDNIIYKLGESMCVRLPRKPKAAGHVEKEQQWLPLLAPHLSVAIPDPIGKGRPTDYYPFPWSVYSWLEGKDALAANITDYDQIAIDLARFLKELWGVDTSNAPLATEINIRGTPLANRDAETREAITAVGNMFDPTALTKAWDRALRAPNWERQPVWIHGDMLPANIIIYRDHVGAVIDFSGICVGDPACDLLIAWNLLPPESRAVLRQAAGVDDATWERGRGHALSQALIFIPYYQDTHPSGVGRAKKTIDNILAEL